MYRLFAWAILIRYLKRFRYKNIKEVFHYAYHITEIPPYNPLGISIGFEMDAPFGNRIDNFLISPHFKVEKFGALTDKLTALPFGSPSGSGKDSISRGIINQLIS